MNIKLLKEMWWFFLFLALSATYCAIDGIIFRVQHNMIVPGDMAIVIMWPISMWALTLIGVFAPSVATTKV